MNEIARKRVRSVIYMLAGVYLIYLAYEIFKENTKSEGEGAVLYLIGAGAFLVIGLGLMGFGLFIMYQVHKEIEQATRELEEASKEN